MNRRIYLLLLSIIVCLSMSSSATAQYTISIISGNGQTGNRGQALKPFIVEVRQNGVPPVPSVFVTFLPDNDDIPWRLSDALTQTNDEGRAQTTLTLLGAGTMTVTASVGNPPVSATFTATAIAGRSTTTSTPSPPPPPEPDPTVFFRVLGDNQSGVVGEPLAKPFVVGARDRGGDLLEGLRVVFGVLTGGGSLSAETVFTDANGRAESRLTLGSEPGTNIVQVSAHGTPRVIIFRAEATLPPVPTTLSIISGDNQTGLTDEVLASPFVVKVRDQYGNPLKATTVIFAVSAGGGSLSDTSVETNINGLAQSILTLGDSLGTNTVEVSVEGIAKTEIFNAEATLPPPTPTSLSIISGEDQVGLTGEPLADPLVVQVHDQYGNLISGVPVTFAVVGPDGMSATTTLTTDANGQAANTLTLDTDPGEYIVQVGVAGIAETVTFTVVVPHEFDLSLPVGLNLIHIPLKVRAVNGLPTGIESVSDLYRALGGTDTVNWLITHDPETQTWHGYFGDADRGTIADTVLIAQTGILVGTNTPISIRLAGDALGMDGTSTITLNPGLNLVGLPLQDSRILHVSDLFALEGITDNVAVIIVRDNGEFKSVVRANDLGDIPITGGQGFILIVQHPVTIPILGDGWQK